MGALLPTRGLNETELHEWFNDHAGYHDYAPS